MPRILTEEKKRIIAREMAGLTGKAAKLKAKTLAKDFKVDVSRIYYYSKDTRPRRKRRADNGAMRAIDKNVFEKLSYYTVKDDFSADHISDIAVANNMGEIAPPTFNRHLRQQGISRRLNKQDLRLYQNFQAPFPNHTHQIDATVSQQFYITEDFRIEYDGLLKEYYAKKKGRQKDKRMLYLLLLIDDHSRATYGEFSASNHTFSWMNFLYNAWKIKEDAGGFPFHGLPKFIYTDQDPIFKSKKFQKTMQILLGKKRVIMHEPGNPRAKGKVERAFQVMQEFEKVTKGCKWQSLEEANADLFDYLYKVNNRVHSRTKMAPFESWINIPAERLLAVPDEEIFRILHMDADWRNINKNMTISLNGQLWQLPWRKPFIEHPNEKVEIYWYPFDATKIYVVIDDQEYEISYKAQDIRSTGKHSELPKPEALKRREEIEQRESPGLKTTQIYKERYRRTYLGKHAQQFDEKKITGGKDRSGPMRTPIWFMAECQKKYYFDSPPTPEQKALVKQVFDGKPELPEAEIAHWLEKLSKGEIEFKQKAVGGI
ncbi:MAG: hypothetical protein ACE5I1_03940 [bacterium]